MKQIKDILVAIRGKKQRELKIFGIQIFLLTKTQPQHTNVFIFFIPFLRIERYKDRFSLNLLILVWLYRMITEWGIIRQGRSWKITFWKKTVVEYAVITPYDFSHVKIDDRPRRKF